MPSLDLAVPPQTSFSNWPLSSHWPLDTPGHRDADVHLGLEKPIIQVLEADASWWAKTTLINLSDSLSLFLHHL
jgi:hypothetical protein